MSADVVPEFFVSRLEHVEDMGNGNVRFWYCADRTAPDGVTETETVLLMIMPLAAISAAAALRRSVLGQTKHLIETLVPAPTVALH